MPHDTTRVANDKGCKWLFVIIYGPYEPDDNIYFIYYMIVMVNFILQQSHYSLIDMSIGADRVYL